jgi:hypothetical protein
VEFHPNAGRPQGSPKRDNGLDMVRVPFRGGAEMANAVLSGTTPVAFLGLSNIVPQLQGGLMTPLAVDGDARSPLLPDVPTLPETGYHDRYLRSWFGLFAPAGIPAAIVTKLAKEVARSRRSRLPPAQFRGARPGAGGGRPRCVGPRHAAGTPDRRQHGQGIRLAAALRGPQVRGG